MDNSSVLLRASRISKHFPGVQALENVDLDIREGEVHGLVGENGAGKSTLVKILMGVHQKDEGQIFVDGNPVEISSPLDARLLGLTAVYQDVVIAPELSVGENFFLGKLPVGRLGIVNWPEVFRVSREMLLELGLDIDPRRRVVDLAPGEQTMVTIAKIFWERPRVVIFDEPTARLTAEEVEQLFRLIRRLKNQNLAIIYISHVLEEIFEICDRVTVLRDARVVATVPVEETDEDHLIALMVGRSLREMYGIAHAALGNPLLQVKDLTREPTFRRISFTLHKGEVLGLYGLVGSGRTALLRALFGAEPGETGEILIEGVTSRVTDPTEAMARGLGLVPEERKLQGLALPLSVKLNINLAAFADVSRLGVVSDRGETRRARQFVDQLNIRTPSLNQSLVNLSGGNQQKVVLAKWLCREANILLLDEPTTGIDVGAKAEIYRLIETLTGQGKGIILNSSYLPEVMGIADRILVMAQGEIVGDIQASEADAEALMRLAAGVSDRWEVGSDGRD